MSKRLLAEFLGTFWLVFGGCGSAVLAAAFPNSASASSASRFAFGLTVLTMAYAVGDISGGHFNPAVSLGLLVAGRFPRKDLLPYIVAQVLGAIVALGGALSHRQRQGRTSPAIGGFATNGYGEHSPGSYSLALGADHRGRADLHVPDDHPAARPTAACRPASRRSPSAWR